MTMPHRNSGFVATPNQDVTYGFGILSLDRGPVIVQVPDFDDRFWVYQLGDQRTDGFGELGKMYGSAAGFYLLAGPDWTGAVPDGVERVFRSPTNIGCVIPRVFMDDTADDRAAVLPLVSQVAAYPLDEFTGDMRTMDWMSLPTFPAPSNAGGGEVQWVAPERFFDVLPQVLNEVAPLNGEESLYDLIRSVLAAADEDDTVKQMLVTIAVEADEELLGPLFQHSNEGLTVKHGWGTLVNAARFGTDYVTRTSCAKANIFANKPEESAYFFIEHGADAKPLTGANNYTVTFAAGELPPVKGFWSLTVYDEYHFFAPNPVNRFSVGTKNRDLVRDPDGSLTIYVQHEPPEGEMAMNWLPAPADDFALFLRAYWPESAVLDGEWSPPPVHAS
jgi:hypothetical protein